MKSLFLIVVSAACVVGCSTEDAPPTTVGDLEKVLCASTKPGNACITIHFTVKDNVRQEASTLKGTLNWALYKDGDVGPLGPGDATKQYHGTVANADFSPPEAVYSINIPNATARKYQALGFLDIDLNGDHNSGDPVTLPSDGFDVPANRWTEPTVVYDYVE